MNLKDKSINDLLDLAKETSCLNEMNYLYSHPTMNVRRVLAKNKNIPETILEKLLDDPVENVSYIASLHQKAEKLHKREFNNLSFCVLCEKDEKNLNCVGCEKVEEHRF